MTLEVVGNIIQLHPGYQYSAFVGDVYDGDSVTVHVDLGLEQWAVFQKCRLYGINAPELHAAGGIEAKAALQQYIRDFALPTEEQFTATLGPRLIVTTHKIRKQLAGREKEQRGKYGRWLLNLYGFNRNTSRQVHINQHMIATGYAVPYMTD